MGRVAIATLPETTLRSTWKDFDLSSLQKTFFCVGPICLRSGYGLGLGIGCGIGFGRGFALMHFGESSGTSFGSSSGIPTQFLYGLPFGYYLSGFLQNISKKFPGSSTGIGCGVGLGYGVGIGLQYGSGGRISMHPGRREHETLGMGRMNLSPLAVPSPTTTSDREEERQQRGKIEQIEKKVQKLEEKLDVYVKLSELERRLELLEKKKK
eukprot:jgi/Galph1/2013/GphlegSOOS_G668.1